MEEPLGRAKLRPKNQLTVPSDVVEYLDLKEGDGLAFFETPDGVLMTKTAIITIKPNKRR